MDFSAPHAGFVIASYALSFVLVAGLALRVVVRDRRMRAEAARLEKARRWNDA